MRPAICFCLALGVAYLVGSFVMADFNTLNWGMPVRLMIAVPGIFSAIGFAAAMYKGN